MSDLQELLGELTGAMQNLELQLQTVVAAPTLAEKKKLETATRPAVKAVKSQLSTMRAEARKASDVTQKNVFERKHKEKIGRAHV